MKKTECQEADEINQGEVDYRNMAKHVNVRLKQLIPSNICEVLAV